MSLLWSLHRKNQNGGFRANPKFVDGFGSNCNWNERRGHRFQGMLFSPSAAAKTIQFWSIGNRRTSFLRRRRRLPLRHHCQSPRRCQGTLSILLLRSVNSDICFLVSLRCWRLKNCCFERLECVLECSVCANTTILYMCHYS